jgi:hypothetical protein
MKRNVSSLLILILTFVLPFSVSASTGTDTNITDFLSPLAVESEVAKVFADTPALIPVAKCESGLEQYNEDGTPFYGGSGGGMVGVMQINEAVHKNTALALGYNIDTLDGNLEYAKYLYEQEGITPWLSSSSCWEGAPDTNTAVKQSFTDASAPSNEEQIENLKKEIAQLEQTIALLLQELQRLQVAKNANTKIVS